MGRKTILQSQSIALILHKQQNSSIQGLFLYLMAGTLYSVFKQTGIHSTTGNAHREFLFKCGEGETPKTKKSKNKNKRKTKKKTKKQNKTTLSRKGKDMMRCVSFVPCYMYL